MRLILYPPLFLINLISRGLGIDGLPNVLGCSVLISPTKTQIAIRSVAIEFTLAWDTGESTPIDLRGKSAAILLLPTQRPIANGLLPITRGQPTVQKGA